MRTNATSESDLFLVATWDLSPGLGPARQLLWAMMAYLSAGLMSAFCLNSVLQVAFYQACVLHCRSVCSVQDVSFSGIVKTSFVWPNQLAMSGCKRG